MNERIRELRNRAWKEIYGVDPDDPRVARAHAHMEEGMAKFAELIVKECMQVSMKAVEMDAEYEAWYLIKHHFGVEE